MANPNFLISAGCSFTKYDPANGKNGNWPGHLSKLLNLENSSLHLGQVGADNSFIAHSIIKALSTIDPHDYKNLLVGIMWSGVSRKSIYFTTPPDAAYNEKYTLDNHFFLIKERKKLYDLYYENFYDITGSAIETCKNILLIQNILKINNINYFFTDYSRDGINNYKKVCATTNVKIYYDKIDQNNFLPVLNMSDWIDNHTNLKYIGNDYHPTAEMSKQFTERVIMPHLKKVGYVQ